MPLWFWGWVVTTGGMALVALIARDRTAAAFVPGAVAATALAGFRLPIEAQWAAFLVLSFPLLVLAVRRRYRRRHARGATDRPAG